MKEIIGVSALGAALGMRLERDKGASSGVVTLECGLVKDIKSGALDRLSRAASKVKSCKSRPTRELIQAGIADLAL
jgi:hypothetical protein